MISTVFPNIPYSDDVQAFISIQKTKLTHHFAYIYFHPNTSMFEQFFLLDILVCIQKGVYLITMQFEKQASTDVTVNRTLASWQRFLQILFWNIVQNCTFKKQNKKKT